MSKTNYIASMQGMPILADRAKKTENGTNIDSALSQKQDSLGINSSTGDAAKFLNEKGQFVATSVAWSNVSGKPTNLSDFTDDITQQNYIASGTGSDKPTSGAAVAQAVANGTAAKAGGLVTTSSTDTDFDLLVPEVNKVVQYSINGADYTNGPSRTTSSGYWGILQVFWRKRNPYQLYIDSYNMAIRYSTTYDSSAGKWTSWNSWVIMRDASWINSGTFDAARIPTSLPNVTVGYTNHETVADFDTLLAAIKAGPLVSHGSFIISSSYTLNGVTIKANTWYTYRWTVTANNGNYGILDIVKGTGTNTTPLERYMLLVDSGVLKILWQIPITNGQTGSTSTPVYVDTDGSVKACSTALECILDYGNVENQGAAAGKYGLLATVYLGNTTNAQVNASFMLYFTDSHSNSTQSISQAELRINKRVNASTIATLTCYDSTFTDKVETIVTWNSSNYCIYVYLKNKTGSWCGVRGVPIQAGTHGGSTNTYPAIALYKNTFSLSSTEGIAATVNTRTISYA